MANPEHLARLLDPLADWNQWRQENSSIVPDLSGADLTGQPLMGLDLSHANLRRADVTGISLWEVDLTGAHAQGLKARNAQFSRCKLNETELSERAEIGSESLPDQLVIDAYGARRSCLTLPAHVDRADLHGAKFFESPLTGAVLDGADLYDTEFWKSPLTRASLVGANLHPKFLYESGFRECNLFEANLSGADFCGADFSGAVLRRALLVDSRFGPLRHVEMKNFTVGPGKSEVESFRHHSDATVFAEADLRESDLRNACFVNADLRNADLRGAKVFGIAAWGVELSGAKQSDLIVTPPDEPALLIDDLEMAQFIYLILNNKKLRNVIDTVTSKVVLILGRFNEDRFPLLRRMRTRLREHGFLPVLFDFACPRSRSLTETVDLLGRMARFVVVEVSEPHCVPHELRGLAGSAPSVPLVLLKQSKCSTYSMLDDLVRQQPNVLEVFEYENDDDLMANFSSGVVDRAEAAVRKLSA